MRLIQAQLAEFFRIGFHVALLKFGRSVALWAALRNRYSDTLNTTLRAAVGSLYRFARKRFIILLCRF